MRSLEKPEELAYKATELIEKIAAQALKQKAILNLAALGITLGMSFATPQVLPPVAFMTIFSIWDMKRSRNALINLRDGFNQVAEGIDGHDSVFQMAPLQKACTQVKNFGLHDLNPVDHFKKDKFLTILTGYTALVTPILTAFATSSLVNLSDTTKLRAIRDAAKESNANLCQKYPSQFPTNEI